MNYIPTKPLKKKYQEKHFHDNRVLVRRGNTQIRKYPQFRHPHAVFLDVLRRVSRQNPNPKPQQFTCGLVPWCLVEATQQPCLVWENPTTPIIPAKRWRLRERKWLIQSHTGCDVFSYSTIQATSQVTWGHLLGNASQVSHWLWALVSPSEPQNPTSLPPSLSRWVIQPEHSSLPLIEWFSTFHQISPEQSQTAFLRPPPTQGFQAKSVLSFSTLSFHCLAGRSALWPLQPLLK